MNDPAVEAANRAWMGHTHPLAQDIAEQGAREALAPLRELHKEIVWYPGQSDKTICSECKLFWPCATAKLIYPDDELDGDR